MSTIYVKTLDGKIFVVENELSTNQKCNVLYKSIVFKTKKMIDFCIPLYIGMNYMDPDKNLSDYNISNCDTIYQKIYSTAFLSSNKIKNDL